MLLSEGNKAFVLRQKLYGKKTTFVRNLHIDYSNVCLHQCPFCAFGKSEQDNKAFFKTIDHVLELIANNQPESLSEVHIVGGVHPHLPYKYYTDLVAKIHTTYPHLCIKAFTATEILHFSKISQKTVSQVLADLQKAGLSLLPGGGAEILIDSIRKQICPKKGSAKDWLNVHECAHNLGLKTNATILFGHLESWQDRLTHLNCIKKLQDQTGGFDSFIPLPFMPTKTEWSHIKPVTAHDILTMIATARVVLDNVPHIKAYWVLTGIVTAQLAQYFGADDWHGTVVTENISHMAGADTPQQLTSDQIAKLIKESGFEPQERDGFFNSAM